jgi:hypothetical protein
VPALIPDKSLGIYMRGGVAADVVGLLVKDPVVVAEFVETIGCAEASRAASDDDHFLVRHAFSRAARGFNASCCEDLSLVMPLLTY